MKVKENQKQLIFELQCETYELKKIRNFKILLKFDWSTWWIDIITFKISRSPQEIQSNIFYFFKILEFLYSFFYILTHEY